MKNIAKILLFTFTTFIFSSCTYKTIFNSATVKQIPLEEYMNKISETDNKIIIDVRTPSEYMKNHYPEAINVNLLKSFKNETKDMDTSLTIFIYCETAHRSPYAAKFLKQNGFTKIYDLEEGYSQYKKYIKEQNNKD